MKQNTINLLLLGGLALLALTGCKEGLKHDYAGEAVRFTASTSQPATKTAYAGNEGTIERIDWEEGDRIKIWSDKAVKRYDSSDKTANYKIKGFTTDGTKSKASLANPDSEYGQPDANGLVWEDEGTYKFWGIYPDAAAMNPTDASVSYLIPGSQRPKGDPKENSGDVTLEPDMNLAVMLAAVENVPGGQDVEIPFYPGFTAFEIQILGADENDEETPIPLEKVELVSTNPLAGQVAATLAAGDRLNGVNRTIGKSMYAISNRQALTYTFPQGTQIVKGKKLTFTVFALPEDFTGLQLRFTLADDDKTIRTAKLKKEGADIQFGACMKYCLYGLAMPDDFKFFFSPVEVEELNGSQTDVKL